MYVVRRFKDNPILRPEINSTFENYSVFNGNPVRVGNQIYMLYRAQSTPEKFENGNFSLSVICKAESRNGFKFKNREVFIMPEYPWEKFGCEDPRVTKIDGKYFCFYTALSSYPFSSSGIKVGLAISNDLKTIYEKHQITPFNAKAMTLFPEKINGKYLAILTANSDKPPSHISIAEFSELEDMWSKKYWDKWYADLDKNTLDIPKFDDEHLEVGSCPLKTKDGWLVVYSNVHNYLSPEKIFTVEAVLLDLKNPRNVIGKTRGALLTPEEVYEKYGTVPNVIFPSGAEIISDRLFIYYGATDTTIATASVPLAPLLASMKFPYKEIGFLRQTEGALISSRKEKSWEAKAVFNPGVIDLDGKIRLL